MESMRISAGSNESDDFAKIFASLERIMHYERQSVFFLLVGKPIQRSEEDKFLFQGDIAMPRIDVIKTLRNRRRKRAVMRKISTGSNLWQTHQLAYIFRNDLGREYTFTSC